MTSNVDFHGRAAGGGEGGGPPALQARDRRVAGEENAVVEPAQSAGPVADRLSGEARAPQLPRRDAARLPARDKAQNVIHEPL
jgi:hypothetical protein